MNDLEHPTRVYCDWLSGISGKCIFTACMWPGSLLVSGVSIGGGGAAVRATKMNGKLIDAFSGTGLPFVFDQANMITIEALGSKYDIFSSVVVLKQTLISDEELCGIPLNLDVSNCNLSPEVSDAPPAAVQYDTYCRN